MIKINTIIQNRYRVIQKLGDGGFGETFEIEDSGVIQVLKVLKIPDIIDEDYQKAVALFQREAQVLSLLNHDGIPKVEPGGYFTIENPDSSEPLHCLVMEKIEGENLHEWQDRQPDIKISETLAINWLKQLLEILQTLHHQQYFHRDIKPANLMLRPQGTLAMIDFGGVREITNTYLAKLAGNRELTGLISAGYTPLEQICGQAVPQSDFFALARTFVQLLTGKHPIDFPQNPDTGQIIWRTEAPQISNTLADLIDSMMAPFPGQRPATATIILERLDSLENASEFTENPVIFTPIESKQKLTIKSRILNIFKSNTIKIGITSLLAGSVGLRLVTPKIATSLNNWGLNNYEAGHLQIAKLNYQLALLLESQHPETNYNLGLIYDDLGNIKNARSHYQIAKQNQIDKAYNNLARLDIIQQQYDSAIELIQQALELNPETTVQFSLFKNLGWANLAKGEYQQAQISLEKALKLNQNHPAPHCLLAQALEAQGKIATARISWQNCAHLPPDNSQEVQLWQQQASQRPLAQSVKLP